MTKAISLLRIERNDVGEAMAYARQRIKAKVLTGDSLRILLRLQDDPAELSKQLNKLLQETKYTPKEHL